MSKESLTQEFIKERFFYDPLIGKFFYRQRVHHKNPCDRAGSNNMQGYNQIKINTVLYQSHRLAWLYVHGEWPNGSIDHINGVRDDNRLSNLRVVDDIGNSRNKAIQRDNSSGITGVSFDVHGGRWVAYIHDGKQIKLKTTKDFFEACCARKSAELAFGYHPNHGRR